MKIFFNPQIHSINNNNKINNHKPARFLAFRGTQENTDSFTKTTKDYEDEKWLKASGAYEDDNMPEEGIEKLRNEEIGALIVTNLTLLGDHIKKQVPNINIMDSIRTHLENRLSPKGSEIANKLIDATGVKTNQEAINLYSYIKTITGKNSELKNYVSKMLLEIYGDIKDKKAVGDYLEILYTMYEDNLFEVDIPQFKEAIEFLRKINIQNSKKFFETFKYYNKKFNDSDDRQTKLAIFNHVKDGYEPKRKLIEESCKLLGKNDTDPNDIYTHNAELLDYLFETEPENGDSKFLSAIIHLTEEEPTKETKKVVSKLMKQDTPEEKLDFFMFLDQENLTINDLNRLTKTKPYYRDGNIQTAILEQSNMVQMLIDSGFNSEDAKEFYLNFAQTLNAIQNHENDEYNTDGISEFIKITQIFDLKDDKDVIEFYKKTNKNTNGSKKPAKQIKNVEEKDIRDFIELMGFLDSSMIGNYKKDRNYPLAHELQIKQNTFNELKDDIENEIERNKAMPLCHSAFKLYTSYSKELKSKENIAPVVYKAINEKIQENKENEDYGKKYDTLLYLFEDERTLQDFIAKCDIRLDEKNHEHTKRCLKIIQALTEGKPDKEAKNVVQKLAQNDFLSNSKTNLAKLISRHSDKDLQTIFEIIIDNDFKTISDFTKRFNGYSGENKKLDNILAYYKKSKLDVDTYLDRLSQIQKGFNLTGIPIVLNNDNIRHLEIKDLQQEKYNNQTIISFANKILSENNKTNFIAGINGSMTKYPVSYKAKHIAKELIKGATGKYQSGFDNINKFLGINKQELNQNNLIGLSKKIDSKFIDFVNSEEWIKLNKNDSQVPNISLHAKLRLIERFLLDEKQDIDLYSEESIQKAKNIIKQVYKDTPEKVSIRNKQDNSFSSYFNYENKEARAVFSKSGEMITIIV